MRNTRRLVLYFLAHITEDSECPGVNDDRPSRNRLERAIRERFGFFWSLRACAFGIPMVG